MNTFYVNNTLRKVEDTCLTKSLLDYLRDDLYFTGVKNGCGEGFCGTCTILVNNKAKRACKLKVSDVLGKEVLTIEGIVRGDQKIHPIQQAFVDAGAIQCGFCSPGFIMATLGLLLEHPDPTEAQIRNALQGNLCRCTGYIQIIEAVRLAAKRMG